MTEETIAQGYDNTRSYLKANPEYTDELLEGIKQAIKATHEVENEKEKAEEDKLKEKIADKKVADKKSDK